ncbi:UNVERIFIED_CONTAM: hypothetical protein K2H54_074507 [Gekko kuhli]
MRQQKLGQTFWTLLLFTQLLWQIGEGKCSIEDCLINVMMLDVYDFTVTAENIRPAVELGLRMLKEDLKVNNVSVHINATFDYFNTSLYLSQGCRTSTCEGVEIMRRLYNSGRLGCTVLGPTCTYATYQMVSASYDRTMISLALQKSTSSLSSAILIQAFQSISATIQR